MENYGFIYALINTSMQGLIKVGKTTRDPKGRANELSGATGVPTPFIVAYSTPFRNCTEAEKIVHTMLEKRCERVSNNREFFRVELNVVIDAILDAKKIDEGINKTTDVILTKELLSPEDVIDSTNNSDIPIWEEYLTLAENYYYGHVDYLQDYEEALNLYKKAANFGALKAFFMLGQMYNNGEGSQNNPKQALKYYNQGVQKGDARCYAEMATIYQHLMEIENAKKCWDKYFKSQIFLDHWDEANEISIKTRHLFTYVRLCVLGGCPRIDQ